MYLYYLWTINILFGCGNGGEFDKNTVRDIFQIKGINHTLSLSLLLYTPVLFRCVRHRQSMFDSLLLQNISRHVVIKLSSIITHHLFDT